MAGKEIKRHFINDTKHCTIGLNPQTTIIIGGQSQSEQPLPWKRPNSYPPHYLAPGHVWFDAQNFYDTLVNQGREKEVFVHCESEEELKYLTEQHPSLNGTFPVQIKKEMVEVPRIVRDSDGKLKGFWGCCYVLKNVSAEMKKAEAMGLSMLSSPDGNALLQQKEIADKAVSERNAMELEKSKMAKAIEELQKELAATKKKQAIK